MCPEQSSNKIVRSNLQFGGIVELVAGEFPPHLYEKFYGPFNGIKDYPSQPKFQAPPDGVIEHNAAEYEPIADGSIIKLSDGRLMLAQGNGIGESLDRTTCRFSEDGGATWSKAEPVDWGMGVGGMIRLASGALAIYGGKTRQRGKTYFSRSTDEGRTWLEPIHIPTHPEFYPMFNSLIQLTSGRLLLCGYWGSAELDCYAPDLWKLDETNTGWWRGLKVPFEGHRRPSMGICKTYYSDDEGVTWQGCKGGVFGWFSAQGVPDGTSGITDVYEPSVAETADGRLLMFARCKRGRLVQSYSLDGGEHWLSMQPTELSCSQSPALLVRIPSSGDLLCIWNQVSAKEIRRGMQRSRLSSAISTDSGENWHHFKTIDACEGMPDMGHIAPEFPIPCLLRGNFELGKVPDNYYSVDYPNIDIVEDQVFVRYSRQWCMQTGEETAEKTGAGVLRIYPLDWFYR